MSASKYYGHEWFFEPKSIMSIWNHDLTDSSGYHYVFDSQVIGATKGGCNGRNTYARESRPKWNSDSSIAVADAITGNKATFAWPPPHSLTCPRQLQILLSILSTHLAGMFSWTLQFPCSHSPLPALVVANFFLCAFLWVGFTVLPSAFSRLSICTSDKPHVLVAIHAFCVTRSCHK